MHVYIYIHSIHIIYIYKYTYRFKGHNAQPLFSFQIDPVAGLRVGDTYLGSESRRLVSGYFSNGVRQEITGFHGDFIYD